MSKQCSNFLDVFQKESSLTTRFIEHVNIVHSSSNVVKFQFMYNKFLKFCKEQGEQSLTQYVFNAEMKKKFVFKRHSSGYVWCICFSK